MSPEKELLEAYALIETLAAAGARLTSLAGNGDVCDGEVIMASNEGTFCESVAHQRIRWLLRCEKAIKSMAAQFVSPITTPEDFVADVLGEPRPKTKGKRPAR